MSNSIQRALISVSDNTGIVAFSSQLIALGVELLSTGGTAKLLRENDLEVIDVSDHTGFEEIMGGRVKTLHPKIHGGILGRRGQDDRVMQDQGIKTIDLVVVNLYPFEQTIANPDCRFEDAIENIDIGGPAMLRAAAKNHRDVAVIVDPNDFEVVIDELGARSSLSDSLRFHLAAKAFEHTAAYDGAIANYFGRKQNESNGQYGRTLNVQYRKKQDMHYGENPHQNRWDPQ